MSYRIAAIDVHKRMLAVVPADVSGTGEFQFDRHKFASTPDQLQVLAEWLVQPARCPARCICARPTPTALPKDARMTTLTPNECSNACSRKN